MSVANDYQRYWEGRYSTDVIEQDGTARTTIRAFYKTVEFLRNQCDPIQVDDTCSIRMEKAGNRNSPLEWGFFLRTPITEEELKQRWAKEFVTQRRKDMASVWNFLMLTWTAWRVTCWPYSTGCSGMVGSWNNRNVKSWCAYQKIHFHHTGGI